MSDWQPIETITGATKMTKTFAVMKRSVFNSFHCFSDKEKAVQKCIDKAESIPGVQVVVVEIVGVYTARKEEK